MELSKQDFENKASATAKELVAYALDKGKKYGITDMVVSISHREETDNSLENGIITEDVSGQSWGVSITLYAGKRTLSFRKNKPDITALKEAIDLNMQVIHLVPENPFAGLVENEKLFKGEEEDLDLLDTNPPSQDELLEYGKKMSLAATGRPGIKTVRDASVSASKGYSYTLATNGFEQTEEGTFFQASVSAVAEGPMPGKENEKEMQIAYDGCAARHFKDMAAPEEIGQKAAEKALAKLGAYTPVSKETNIVLSPTAAQTFFSAIMAAIDGAAVYRGTTFLKDKIGQQVVNPSITIEDDPRIARALRSQVTDSTGMESKKLTFIDRGILKTFNVSLTDSRQLGIEPIGRNGAKSGGLGNHTNLSVLPGSQSVDDLIADIKDGVYIEGFSGGTANVANGSFSRPAYGSVIKDGKITDEHISGFVVAGNLKQMFMNAVVADDTPKLPDPRRSMATPTTRIDGIKIAGL